MATVDAPRYAYEHPRRVTAVLSVIGYALVASAFADLLPLFPELSRETVLLFSDAIAVVNSIALLTLLAGAAFIKRGDVRKHRAAMLAAFALICVFLVLYLWKVGGGFEKGIVIEEGQFLAAYAGTVKLAYLAMLAVHILLSVLAVPVVLHAVVLGLTHDPSELVDTSHPTVGRIAVAAWSTSLFLGVVTYWMLNHVYSWAPR
ncbi:DUF420 domain-containing protein [Halobacterium bonnevillei]|uniref:DUF420 domain-containing protein n=1 Tax=Halobacterium bonnevillei TaxID=2692200 RepID=A0A6B0SLR3_9EURY|nr:DUF420 domain-containing protein [Halobacterium bonnevillei]MXR20453.1 DUF420 domain-containing protein [Halobacterium bonnevillei]